MSSIEDLPSDEGVYILYKKNNDGVLNPCYIGQTTCIKRRVQEHTQIFDSVSWLIIRNKEKRLETERELIGKYDPKGNTQELNWLGEHFGNLERHLSKTEELKNITKDEIELINEKYSGFKKKCRKKKYQKYKNFFEDVEYRINKIRKQLDNMKDKLPNDTVSYANKVLSSGSQKAPDEVSFKKSSKMVEEDEKG